jgi:pimeloyl-ACP methyl ester carboxylesterase
VAPARTDAASGAAVRSNASPPRAIKAYPGGVVTRVLNSGLAEDARRTHDLVDTLIEASLKVPAHVWKETLRGLIDTDVRAYLGRITAPTLLIAGDDDAFVSEDQPLLLDAIPDARLEPYEGVGHGVHLAQPERVVSDIVGFLTSTRRSR